GVLAVLGAVALAPVLSTPQTAQAAPRAARQQTVRGTVAVNLAGNKHFTVRLDDRRTVEVVTHEAEPARLSRGDRVEMTGHYDRNLFIARTVRMLQQAKTGRISGRNRGNPNHPWVDFTGTVLSVQSAYQLQVRANNGVKYEVRSHDKLSSTITSGDTVHIAGRAFQGIARPDHVTLVRNNNAPRGPGSVQGNQWVDFTGTVLSVESPYRLRVRANNGANYQVNPRDKLSPAITRGDTVRIAGYASAGIARPDHVTLVRNNASGTTVPNQTVNFIGTVLSVKRAFGSIGDLEVRGDNGQVYRVRTKNATAFKKGDRVRVAGTYSKGSVSASSVTRF
ncbi:MAG TPA: hypothetical protein VNA16_04650, partial [Abditibacteriaceae bacterium]|nr:hypothetical protein [Abditibacteriaceae bacterium]